jgi:hypothetical protein
MRAMSRRSLKDLPMESNKMNKLSMFDRVYVINLPSRTDRKKQMEHQLEQLGLSFRSPNVRLFPAIRPTDAGGFETIGARGCFMSHLGVLRDAVGLKSVLILEDDLDFVANAKMPSLPSDWGIFYGGARHSIPPTSGLTKAEPSDLVVCAHFVAFNGPVIAPLVAHLEAILQRPPGDPRGGPMHVDGAYGHFRAENPNVKVLIATPELGFQRPSRTDIHELKWFDKTPVVRDAVQMLRSMRRIKPHSG